jgi:hypothetical protein
MERRRAALFWKAKCVLLDGCPCQNNVREEFVAKYLLSVGPLPRLRNFTREKDSVAPGHVLQLWKESLPHSGEQELKQRFNSHVHIYKI